MAWTKEQLKAIEESGNNILVSAGAGSGKTAVLTTRVMEKVHQGIHVNELLILTFTNAAASEMKERIKKNLVKEHNEEELSLLDSSYITTFDSFSLSLVKKYHYLLNLPKKISITDSSIIELEKKKILDSVMESYYEKKDNDFCALIEFLCVKDDAGFKSDLLHIISKLEIRTDLEMYLNTYLDFHYQEEVYSWIIEEYTSIIQQKIQELQLEIEEHEAYFDTEYYQKILSSLSAVLQSQNLESSLAAIQVAKLPILPRNSDEEVKKAKSEIQAILTSLKELASYHNEEEIKKEYLETKPYISVVISILKDFFHAFSCYKQSKQIFDFNDIAKMSLQLIKTHEDIQQELKKQFQEIMVDEYQDTSDLQEEFISLISDHNVYMVGDIKQSIYRFRNANPSIFKEKYEAYAKGEDGIKIDLLKNFRSRKEVLEDINLIFNPIMDLEIGEADYTASHQMVYGNLAYQEQGYTSQNYHMDVLTYSCEETTYSKEEIEFFTIAQDINQKLQENYQVFDKDTLELRPATYKDFCLILDRNSSFDLAKKIFAYFDIPLSLYKDEELNQSDNIYLVKHLLSFLLHMKRKVYDEDYAYSFVSIARSFLYRYQDAEIYDFVIHQHIYDSSIYHDFLPLLSSLPTMSIYNVLEKILEVTHYYERLIVYGNVKENIARMDKILELAQSCDDLSYGMEKFTEFLDELLKREESIRIGMSTSTSDSVKMMNIHKSKGLEFPICYFCGLYKNFSRQDYQGDLLYEKNFPIYTPVFRNGIKESIIKTLIKEDILKNDVSEKIRLFYVALTRAKEKMIFVLPKKEGLVERKDANDVVFSSVRHAYHSLADLLYSIPKRIKHYEKEIDLPSLHLTKDYLLPKKKTRDSLMVENHLEIFERAYIQNQTKPRTFSKQIAKVMTMQEKKNLELGTLFHETLEYVDFHRYDPTLIENPWVREKIKNLLDSPLFEQVNLATVYHEYEFIFEEDKQVYHGQIDLMLEYEDHIDLVDYKLNNLQDEAYVKQLEGYQHYIEQITSKIVHTYLFSILTGQIKKIG